MKIKAVSIVLSALLLAACAREQSNSDGNGTGNADGVGGRQDPPTAPANAPLPSDQIEDAASAPPPPPPSQR